HSHSRSDCRRMNFHIEEMNAAHMSASVPALVELWNQTLGAEFAISVPCLTHRLTHPPTWPTTLVQARIDNRLAHQNDTPNADQEPPVGFALLSAPPAAPASGSAPQIH